jgi:hypothetical protein
MRLPLHGLQLVRFDRHNRKAGFGKIETLYIERSADERRGLAAGLEDIAIGFRVGLRNQAAKAWIVVTLDRREGREFVRKFRNTLDDPAESIDNDHRALGFAETQELGLHRICSTKMEGDVSVPLPNDASPDQKV